MIKVKNKYETIFIVDVDRTEEEIEALVEKFKLLISEAGEISNVDVWGKRRLAYPINDKNEGYYVFVEFTAEAEFIKELNRVYGITEGIMRSLVIRQED